MLVLFENRYWRRIPISFFNTCVFSKWSVESNSNCICDLDLSPEWQIQASASRQESSSWVRDSDTGIPRTSRWNVNFISFSVSSRHPLNCSHKHGSRLFVVESSHFHTTLSSLSHIQCTESTTLSLVVIWWEFTTHIYHHVIFFWSPHINKPWDVVISCNIKLV